MSSCLKMKLRGHFLRLILLWVFPVVYSDCDPETQYFKDGMCCPMCKPGTRMSSSNTGCVDPQCKPCLENEYQPDYTKETHCKLQPYCDPNKNFELMSDKSKTSLSQCMCKSGHHCSSEECMTCVPHTKCGLGLGVLYKGNHTHDTVCQACPADTFSSENSAESKCVPWKHCQSGFIVGTPTSDTVCVQGLSHATKAAIGVTVFGALFTACVVILWKIKGKRGQADIGREGKRCCVEWCTPDGETVVEAVHHEDARLIILVEEDKQPEHEDAHIMIPEVGQPQQSEHTSIPEETEDITQAQGTTENGQLVKQEVGKSHTSMPESEMGNLMHPHYQPESPSSI